MSKDFSGERVWPAVVVLVALTAVAPPAAATALASWRVARAQQTAVETAERLAVSKGALHELAGQVEVLCGQGRLPGAAMEARRWLEKPVGATGELARAWPSDPWGSCYLLNVRAMLDGRGGLLISAGPNGELETPLEAAAPSGDDIASTVR